MLLNLVNKVKPFILPIMMLFPSLIHPSCVFCNVGVALVVKICPAEKLKMFQTICWRRSFVSIHLPKKQTLPRRWVLASWSFVKIHLDGCWKLVENDSSTKRLTSCPEQSTDLGCKLLAFCQALSKSVQGLQRQ